VAGPHQRHELGVGMGRPQMLHDHSPAMLGLHDLHRGGTPRTLLARLGPGRNNGLTRMRNEYLGDTPGAASIQKSTRLGARTSDSRRNETLRTCEVPSRLLNSTGHFIRPSPEICA